ncbi:MAG: hypothetical protein IJ228_01270 [Succinivibrio sp.]|nr:hypothetical protein [Succinivibrio sp.]
MSLSPSLPSSELIDTRRLAGVFRNTTQSYKFFWFLSILDLSSAQKPRTFEIADLTLQMCVNAWYPLYCKLNLGPKDALAAIRESLISRYSIGEDLEATQLRQQLLNCREQDCATFDKLVKKRLAVYVPTRFLSAWIDESNDLKMKVLSRNFTGGCLYRLDPQSSTITLNDAYWDYLRENHAILRDFTYWNLLDYLQRRNPKDQFIVYKLVRNEGRESLVVQRKFWDFVIGQGCRILCPYSGKIIAPGDTYDLDHFIPWRYVASNAAWNLTPANPSLNSAKSDNLPPLDFIKPLALNQQHALQTYVKHYGPKSNGKFQEVIDDYLSLGRKPSEIAVMGTEELFTFFKELITPLYLQAHSKGFNLWNYSNVA